MDPTGERWGHLKTEEFLRKEGNVMTRKLDKISEAIIFRYWVTENTGL